MNNQDELFREGEFRQRLGPNIIEQFVKSHDLVGMIAELIQNDFDAKSRRHRIHFLKDRLVVISHGMEVDRKGWERLSYWLGVGQESAKTGSIGRKNFGLRSLFLISNRIVISTGGYKTAIDVEKGALKKRIKDDVVYQENFSFRAEAEYREEPLGKLPVFTIEWEQELFSSIEKQLLFFVQFLVCAKQQKICTLRRGKELLRPYEIEIISERLSKSLTCSTSMWEDKHIGGLLNRRVYQEVIEDGKSKSNKSRVTEILLAIDHFDDMPVSEIPPYYLSRDGNKVIAGISFAVDEKGNSPLALQHYGRLFYPIGMREQYTGLGFSLNAPFQLDMDRDRIVNEDDWNKYILTQTGKELGNIFFTKIFPKYGPKAYLLLASVKTDNAHHEFYKNALESMRQYIINDRYDPHKKVKKEQLCELDEQKLPKGYLPSRISNGKVTPFIDLYPVMVSQVGRGRTLSRHLARLLVKMDESTLKKFLDEFGIKTFTIHNICQLLVNDGKVKHTFGEGIHWHYPSEELFEKAYSDMDFIRIHLDMLHKYWDLLTREEITALKESKWLRAADDSPKCFNHLRLWSGDTKDFIWPERSSIVHPKLASHPVFQRSGFELPNFKVIEIIEEKARQSEKLDNNEKETLFNFLASNWKYILGKRWMVKQGLTKELKKLRDIVKKYPVLKDWTGNWVRLGELRMVEPKTKQVFGLSLHYPHPTIPKRLLSVLQTPTTLEVPGDIIKRCDTLELATKEEVFSFEDYLSKARLEGETKNEIYEHLWSVCQDGNEQRVVKTSKAYITSERLEKLIGTDVFPYLVVRNDKIRRFFQRIGVREKPSFDDMVRYLNYLKDNKGFLQDKKLFYRELANAAERESLGKEDVASRPIILIGWELFPPKKVVISRNLFEYFKKGIRYWPESKIDTSLRTDLGKLGCKEKIVRGHLIDYLAWISEEYETNKQIGLAEKEGIHRAYLDLEAFRSDEISEDVRIFLSRSGKLFSRRDIDNGILRFDDMPEVARAFCDQKINIELADYGNGRRFIDSSGIKPLSALIESVVVKLGNKVGEHHKLSSKISSRCLKNALMSANDQELGKILDSGKIKGLRRATIFDSVSKHYSLTSREVEVPAEVAISKDGGDYVLCIREGCEDYGIIAKEISSFLISNLDERHRAIDFIMILLLSESEKQVVDYLSLKNIDYLDHFRQKTEEHEQDESYKDEEPIVQEKAEVSDDVPIEKALEGETHSGALFPSSLTPREKLPKYKGGFTVDEPVDTEHDPDEKQEEETLEEMKKREASTQGRPVPTSKQERPPDVIEMQTRIKREYDKCQLCGLPVFLGINTPKVYGHLRGHHLIPWQEKPTTIDGLLCLCQPHHHMVHHAREVLFRINKSRSNVEVFVNGKSEGIIDTKKGHDVVEYLLENTREIERHSENVKVEVLE